MLQSIMWQYIVETINLVIIIIIMWQIILVEFYHYIIDYVTEH